MRKGDQNPIIQIGRPAREMLIQMTAFRVGAISIVSSEGNLLGLVTDYDIRKTLESDDNIASMRIAEIMNPPPAFVYSDQRAVDALEMMKQRQKPTAVLPVLNRERKVVEMVHLHDLISEGL